MRMTRHIALVAFVTVPLYAQSAALDAAAKAMGGKDRILALRSFVYDGTGSQLNFGQNYTPYTDTSRFEITAYHRVLDYANRRQMNDFTRVPRFITAITTPQRTRNGLDGDVAFNIAANGAGTRLAAQIALDRQEEMLYHPIGFIRAAYAPGVVVSETAAGAERLVKLRIGRKTYTMAVDTRTMLPSRIDNTIDNPMLGDAVISNQYSDYRDVAGIKVPMRLVQKLDRWNGLDFTFATATIDGDVGAIAATDSVRALPLPAPAAAPNIVVEDLAPGVWWIGGGTHHTIAIEQADRIVLVEAPQSEDRTTAVISRARTLVPNKPVTTVINTHHHFDHAGGLRAAMAQGLEIITHEGNKDFYERYVYGRPHSIAPDALATMTPVQLQLSTVSDKRVLNDASHPIEIYTVPGNPHVGTMLMVYLPKEKILVQADMYNPPAANAATPLPPFPFAADLLDNVKRRGLQIDRVVGIHGRPVPFSEVVAAAAK